MSSVIIREAKESDCLSLHQFINGLIETKQSTASSIISAKELQDHGFGTSLYQCLVAERNDVLVGCALYYYTYSTWEGRSLCMEDLVVSPSEDEKLALALWKELVKIATQIGCSRCNFVSSRNNTAKVAWYLDQGAIDLSQAEDWHLFRMDHNAMMQFIQGDKVPEGIRVRETSPKDCLHIRQQIQELADYEKMPDGPKIDAATLEEDGFGDQVFYKSFVAEKDGQMVGYTLFFLTFSWEGSGVYMEDLYVAPAFRGKGIGMALWRQVIKAGLAVKGTKCEFAVLDWNKPSIDFYKSKGAVDVTELRGVHFFRMVKEKMDLFLQS